MTILWLLLSLLALAAWLVWLGRLVARDGLGDRRPPASLTAGDDQRDGWSSAPLGAGR